MKNKNNNDLIEIEFYSLFLNKTIGLGGILLAATLAGAPHAGLFFVLVSICLLGLNNQVSNLFPSIIRDARRIAREHPENETIQNKLEGLEAALFSFKRVAMKNYPYLIGSTTYVVCLIYYACVEVAYLRAIIGR